MKIRFSLFLLLFTSISLLAQIEMPSLSPKKITKQEVGLANFTLEYGQPSKNGRKIYGSLIPYGKLWRTGANASTKITVDKEVSFSGNKIPAGTYGLYSIPNKKEWTIIIHKKSKLWGAGGYQKENDLVRFTVPSQKTNDITQTLNIRFENFTINGADLVISWEKTKITIPVHVDSDAIIENQIKTKITSTDKIINPQTYFDAAQYYYQKNKNLNTAFEWFNKAVELRPQAFWYVYYKAELALKLGKDDIAKEGATKCLKAAKNSKSSDYGYIAKCSILFKSIKN
ncbi:DUF2911 domain-containing protein [Tenacibaculum sp. S7007]|uniref:DUF2911 domain-containing protein n=1 Tax=Tenacibaculum pelagium TaxID=2759527 RepID=A0A839ASA8_9FLAO|nr:DUF2911 domain-containing protein [Tenacibaculum pelagium]MBA6157169.1 DUF2911 domain-containing protein [Tenacibaculum pelagium]